jgi:PhzF family phenazine biosynthesis protein
VTERIRIWQVDAFADAAYVGNPAAVCPLDEERSDTWLQALAAELNLSETAFVRPIEGGYALRWFTPTVEVPLCGHATLASAHVLWETERLAPDEAARFHTQSGELVALRSPDGAIEMRFPQLAHRKAQAPRGLLEALGARARFVAETDLHRDCWLVELADEAAVRALDPDFGALRTLGYSVIVTAPALADGVDFVSRFFAPPAGIDEDPVTGAAHCVLGPYWAAKLGRPEVSGFQASARGGRVGVRLDGDRAVLRGRAVTVFCAELTALAALDHGDR